jgi:hypothetical protein
MKKLRNKGRKRDVTRNNLETRRKIERKERKKDVADGSQLLLNTPETFECSRQPATRLT